MVGNGNVGKAAISNVGATGKTSNAKATEAKAPVAAIAGITQGLKSNPTPSTSFIGNAGEFAAGNKETAVAQYLS